MGRRRLYLLTDTGMRVRYRAAPVTSSGRAYGGPMSPLACEPIYVAPANDLTGGGGAECLPTMLRATMLPITGSEVELQSGLHNAGCAGVTNHTEVAGRNVRGRVPQVHVVESIEHLPPELERLRLGEFDVL